MKHNTSNKSTRIFKFLRRNHDNIGVSVTLLIVAAGYLYGGAQAFGYEPEQSEDTYLQEAYERDNYLNDESRMPERDLDGMHFSGEYVTEEYEYDDEYILRYNDPDAGLSDVEISVDLKTYKLAIWSITDGIAQDMTGTLHYNEQASTPERTVYTYQPDREGRRNVWQVYFGN